MASTRKKSRRAAETVTEPAKSDFWGSRVRPWIEARAGRITLCLILIGTIRIVAAYPETGITFDEPGHMACGLQFLAQHVYRYETQHPPLARVLSALGPYLDGARPMGIANQNDEGVGVIYRNVRILRTLILMRLGILPFFPLACLVVYLWSARYFNKLVAVFATVLFTLIPPVLAHAGVATTDMPVATCLAGAFLALMVWAETPGGRQSVVLGIATGLMVLSKFTGLLFLPAAAILALAAFFAAERPAVARVAALARKRTGPFLLAVITGAIVIWSGYRFSFGIVPGWKIALPAPEVFDGVRTALYHNTVGHPAYLLGQTILNGVWYYFPVVLAVKTPVAFLVLVAAGASICWKNRRSAAYWMPVALSLGVLMPAMMGHVNIGVRHILAVYIGLSIVAAIGIEWLLDRARSRRWIGAVATVLTLWMAFTGAWQHPDYLGYFNELAGGSPERILVDSDLDWGQDTVRLARRLRDMGVRECSFMTLLLNPQQLQTWPGIPVVQSSDPQVPVSGWTVISPTTAFLFRDPRSTAAPWYERVQPVEKVGSLSVYYLAPAPSSPAR